VYSVRATGYPPDYFAGVRVTVMGLGQFGGQLAAIRFLVRQGATVTVTDLADENHLRTSLDAIKDLPVALHLGGHIENDFTDTDLIVVSPAVPKTSRYLRLAREKGIPITTEMNLFLDRCVGRIVGVTGTTGKSTTTALIDHILNHAKRNGSGRANYGKVWVGGNIGKSLLESLSRIKHDDVVVLELSSFQLEDLGNLEKSPQVAVITNVRPNHLDRHVTMDAYIAAKANITRFQDAGDVLITNARDKPSQRIVDAKPHMVAHWQFAGTEVRACPAVTVVEHDGKPWFRACTDRLQQLICPVQQLRLPGAHNVENAAAAIAAALAVGVPADKIGAALNEFRGLPDRLELVGQVNGVKYYNDSKSTTPDAGIVALNAFDAPVIAIVGGYDKSVCLDDFARHLARRAKAVVCIGQTAGQLVEKVTNFAGNRSPLEIRQVEGLEEAVHLAGSLACAGDVVLLSPGCASWDMFDNYQQRGRVFKDAVRRLAESQASVERV